MEQAFRARIYLRPILVARNSKRLDFFAAELSKAKLHRAKFKFAKLGAANLVGVEGNAVIFTYAELQAVSLNSANLPCALLDGAQLQGVTIAGSVLDNVRLGASTSEPTVIWKVDARSAKSLRLREGHVCGATASAPRKCVLQTPIDKSYEDLLDIVQREVPKGPLQLSAIRRLEALKRDPQREAQEAEMEGVWGELERIPSKASTTSTTCP